VCASLPCGLCVRACGMGPLLYVWSVRGRVGSMCDTRGKEEEEERVTSKEGERLYLRAKFARRAGWDQHTIEQEAAAARRRRAGPPKSVGESAALRGLAGAADEATRHSLSPPRGAPETFQGNATPGATSRVGGGGSGGRGGGGGGGGARFLEPYQGSKTRPR
jgi:hypothetical protein